MKKTMLMAVLIMAVCCYAYAIDPPHDASDPATPVSCNSCHALHKATSPSLTVGSSNANTCMGACHNPAGTASGRPFNDLDQADIPGVTGNSHRWDTRMAPVGDPGYDAAMYGPGSQFGLRVPAADPQNPAFDGSEIQDLNINIMLQKFDYVITCSVCHGQHTQARNAWDPYSPAYSGAGTGAGRHMQRIENDINQLCIDCHYYKTTAAQTDVKTWDGNRKSHPVVKIFTSDNGETPDVANPDSFLPAPSEPDAGWTPQTGARYHLDSDGNPTNNIVLDATGRVRCLSCHGIHYTDSDSTTVDVP